MRTPELIRDLSERLEPVRPLAPPWRRALGWGLISATFVAAALAIGGPARPGVLDQIIGVPRFAAEIVLGVGASALGAWIAFSLSVPGLADTWIRRWAAVGLLALWCALLVYGLDHPAIAPSMEGKRPHCLYETIGYSIPPLILMLVLAARAAPVRGAWVGALAGLASGALPATAMQIACLYSPEHALRFHVAPVAGMAIVGALAGWRFIPRL
ncbi:MAG: DUF1109 family protein [Myxococcales bacterium]|nr:DUF1109 family protein [Myxococcales bacterium]